MSKEEKMTIKYGCKEEAIFFKGSIFSEINADIYITADNFYGDINKLFDLSLQFDFIIDPSTYSWLYDDEEITNKKKKYFEDIFGDENINFEDKIHKLLNDNTFLKSTVDKCIHNQISWYKQFLKKSIDEIESKYLPFLNDNFKKVDIIIPPYFVAKENSDKDIITKIMKINEKINKYILSLLNSTLFGKKIIFPVLFYPKWLLNDDLNLENQIIDSYKDILNKDTIFWLANFSLINYKIEDQQKIISFLNKFTSQNKYLLHSDFVTSLLLNENLLSNNFKQIITNLGYGESRDFYGIGRQPKIYFYAPKLHKRLNSFLFEKYLSKNQIINENGIINYEIFKTKICNCVFCENMIKNENNVFKIIKLLQQSNETLNDRDIELKKFLKLYFLQHFINWKNDEYKKLSSLNNKDLIEYLHNMIFEYKNSLNVDMQKELLNQKNENNINNLIEIINDNYEKNKKS